MPFFVVEVGYRAASDGSLQPRFGQRNREAYPTYAAAMDAVQATAALRQRRREGWERAYEQPFPGEAYRLVEATDATHAARRVHGLPDGEEYGQIRVGMPVILKTVVLRSGVKREMPPEVRAAYERWHQRPLAPRTTDDSTVEELEAYYRWERKWGRVSEAQQADLRLYWQWLEEQQAAEADS